MPQCTYIIRGKKQCARDAVDGSVTCRVHDPVEIERQCEMREKRRRIDPPAGQEVHQKPEAADFVQRLLAAEPMLAPVETRIRSLAQAGRIFESLCDKTGKALWQQAKRAWHQPQVESLSAIALDCLEHHRSVVAVELGAGKGLLGTVVSQLADVDVIFVEKRHVATGAQGDTTSSSSVHDETAVEIGDSGLRTSRRMKRVEADLQEVNLADVTEDSPCFAIAKHFCGNATDLALRKIEEVIRAPLGPGLHGAMIAPCCHPKMCWDSYTGRDHLSRCGFKKADFPALLHLIEASRERTATARSVSCRKVLSFTTAEPDATCSMLTTTAGIHRLGRLARRVIEEGRLLFLRQACDAADVSIRVIEYVPHSVTPDNLVLLLETASSKSGPPGAGLSCSDPLGSSTHCPASKSGADQNTNGGSSTSRLPSPVSRLPAIPYSSTGVALHLCSSALSDLPVRCVEYLLEKRDRGEFDGISAVWAADIRASGRVLADGASADVVMVHVEGSRLDAVLKQLSSDRLLTRVVDKAFPFQFCSSSLEEVLLHDSQLVSRMAEDDSSARLSRIYACPKALEQRAVEVVVQKAREAEEDTAMLHATNFTSVVSIFEWALSYDDPIQYLWSQMPIATWDPRRWPTLGARAPADQGVDRLFELGVRKGVEFARKKVAIVLPSGQQGNRHAAVIELLRKDCEDVAVFRATVGRDGVVWDSASESPLQQSAGVDLLLVMADCTRDDTLLVLRSCAARFGAGVAFVCPLKLCPPAKKSNPSALKAAHAAVASALSDTADDVSIHHLLADKENERTLTGRLCPSRSAKVDAAASSAAVRETC
ncbi:tRNA:m(4)X modification enzyme TRM13 [Diplonema papillatum]|nr:tRNA:m(4)X modification enzyme TRM13 [Diplonema papillatum]